MLVSPSSVRALAFLHRRLPPPPPPPRPHLLQPPTHPAPPRSAMAFSAEPAAEEAEEEALPPVTGPGEVTAEEWRRWGTSSPLPAAVAAVVGELLEMEAEAGQKMRFGGVGSKIKGDFKDMEDKKHRAVYQTLADSDKKLQYFSARQIACRLLGSRGYLCQKDFLRQNNTGKLLWQVFGIQAAPLCLFGIQEHEDIMWDAFQRSGKGKVSFLYPNKSTTPMSVKDLKFDGLNLSCDHPEEDVKDEPFNFVLLDGTWSNSAALYRRLKRSATGRWRIGEKPKIETASRVAGGRCRRNSLHGHHQLLGTDAISLVAAASCWHLLSLHRLPSPRQGGAGVGADVLEEGDLVEGGLAVGLGGLERRGVDGEAELPAKHWISALAASDYHREREAIGGVRDCLILEMELEHERWTAIWGEEDIPCISLSTLSASVMHKLRPQPAWDRTCTAAAASGLLWELDMRSELGAFELGKQAEAVECSLDVLLDALTARRLRLGRSITRKQRHNRNCI
uniref:tRNA-uridine aminocarboxypropyltransferase n=1 Tax=Oryza glumipatula TaxID=40148 RepID=A0A0E0A977_9ORYZ